MASIANDIDIRFSSKVIYVFMCLYYYFMSLWFHLPCFQINFLSVIALARHRNYFTLSSFFFAFAYQRCWEKGIRDRVEEPVEIAKDARSCWSCETLMISVARSRFDDAHDRSSRSPVRKEERSKKTKTNEKRRKIKYVQVVMTTVKMRK